MFSSTTNHLPQDPSWESLSTFPTLHLKFTPKYCIQCLIFLRYIWLMLLLHTTIFHQEPSVTNQSVTIRDVCLNVQEISQSLWWFGLCAQSYTVRCRKSVCRKFQPSVTGNCNEVSRGKWQTGAYKVVSGTAPPHTHVFAQRPYNIFLWQDCFY